MRYLPLTFFWSFHLTHVDARTRRDSISTFSFLENTCRGAPTGPPRSTIRDGATTDCVVGGEQSPLCSTCRRDRSSDARLGLYHAALALCRCRPESSGFLQSLRTTSGEAQKYLEQSEGERGGAKKKKEQRIERAFSKKKREPTRCPRKPRSAHPKRANRKDAPP